MAMKHIFYTAMDGLLGPWRPGQWLGSRLNPDDLPLLRSGLPAVERALGFKGLPQGHMVELIGPDGTGNIAIATKIAAYNQRKQIPVHIIDMCGSFSAEQATRCGLSALDLLHHVPQNVFEVISLMEQFANQAGLVIISLGLVPQTLAVATPAQLTSLLLRWRRIVSRSDSVFLFLTTLLEDDPFIHLNYPPGFPLNEVADVRLWVQDEGWIKRGQEITGYRGSVTVIKNRLAESGHAANVRITFVDPRLTLMEDELDF